MLARLLSFFKTRSNVNQRTSSSTTAPLDLKPSSRIVIVGGGCFGVSTALHLLRRGYKDVTVLERATELPAADAAGTDINKAVRSSYDDEFYTSLAREAIEDWKDRSIWGDTYHESGVLSCGIGASLFADPAFQNDLKHGARIKKVVTTTDQDGADGNAVSDTQNLESTSLDELFRSDIPLGPTITNKRGYFNAEGGWVYSTGAMERIIKLVAKLGGKIISGKEVSSTIKVKSRTSGVKCKDGSEFPADIVILATGSWTSSTFPELKLGNRARATGHAIVTVQLTQEEGDQYRNVPVVLDLCSSGFYCFPPTEDNLLKIGVHYGGVTNMVPAANASIISAPRTVLSHGDDGLRIPRSEARLLRECLRNAFPGLADRPFKGTRLCWYTDSPDSNWIIDMHPEDPGLALVTAGSGHGFKFLPVIGRLVADRLEGKMDDATRKRFAVNREIKETKSHGDGAGVGVLNINELVGPGDEL